MCHNSTHRQNSDRLRALSTSCNTTLLTITSPRKMVSQRLSSLSAVRKQHLLVELYASFPSTNPREPANSLLQLESQVRLSTRRVHEPHTGRPHAVVRRNIRTERSLSQSKLFRSSEANTPKDPTPPQSCDSKSPSHQHTPLSPLS